MLQAPLAATVAGRAQGLLRAWEKRSEAGMADMSIPPNQTVYVNNLPDKIKKEGALALCLLLQSMQERSH